MHRPTSITILGTLNLIFAALGMCGLFAALMSFSAVGPGGGDPSSASFTEIMEKHPAFGLYLRISMVLGFIGNIALGLAGIGLLQMRSWGRWLSVGWALYAVVAAVVGMVMNMRFLGPLLVEDGAAGQAGAAAGGMMGFCCGAAYPIVLLIFMFLPDVAQAFRIQQAGGEKAEGRV